MGRGGRFLAAELSIIEITRTAERLARTYDGVERVGPSMDLDRHDSIATQW